MRKITIITAAAFNNNNNFILDNTEIRTDGKTTKMFLFDNLIAVKDIKKDVLKITLAGWDTVTTRERLRGITAGLKRIKGDNFINGVKWVKTWFNVTTGKEAREPKPAKEPDIFKFMGAFLQMGNLTQTGEDLQSKVKYKERIIFATMKNQIPGWTAPADWSTITDAEKLKRLTKIEETI